MKAVCDEYSCYIFHSTTLMCIYRSISNQNRIVSVSRQVWTMNDYYHIALSRDMFSQCSGSVVCVCANWMEWLLDSVNGIYIIVVIIIIIIIILLLLFWSMFFSFIIIQVHMYTYTHISIIIIITNFSRKSKKWQGYDDDDYDIYNYANICINTCQNVVSYIIFCFLLH